MSVVLVAGALVRGQIVCLDTDQVSISTFFYLVSNSPAPTLTDADWALGFDAQVGANVKAILNNNAQYRGVISQITDLFGKALFVSRSSVVGAGTGTGGPDALPKQACGITSWYTALPRQANRGRTFWPFPATAHDTGDGTPDVTYVTQVDALAAAIQTFTTFTTGGRTANFSFQLQHRKLGNVTAVIARTTRSVWATQRRRGAYGRQNHPPI